MEQIKENTKTALREMFILIVTYKMEFAHLFEQLCETLPAQSDNQKAKLLGISATSYSNYKDPDIHSKPRKDKALAIFDRFFALGVITKNADKIIAVYNMIIQKQSDKIKKKANNWINILKPYIINDGGIFCLTFFALFVFLCFVNHILGAVITWDTLRMIISFCWTIFSLGFLYYSWSCTRQIRLIAVTIFMLYFCLLRKYMFYAADLFARYFFAFLLLVFVNYAIVLLYNHIDLSIIDKKRYFVAVKYTKQLILLYAKLATAISAAGAVYCLFFIGFFISRGLIYG